MSKPKISIEAARHSVIARGVKACRDFGWPHATMENIITDRVYSMFFRSTLEDALQGDNSNADKLLQSIIDEIDSHKEEK